MSSLKFTDPVLPGAGLVERIVESKLEDLGLFWDSVPATDSLQRHTICYATIGSSLRKCDRAFVEELTDRCAMLSFPSNTRCGGQILTITIAMQENLESIITDVLSTFDIPIFDDWLSKVYEWDDHKARNISFLRSCKSLWQDFHRVCGD